MVLQNPCPCCFLQTGAGSRTPSWWRDTRVGNPLQTHTHKINRLFYESHTGSNTSFKFRSNPWRRWVSYVSRILHHRYRPTNQIFPCFFLVVLRLQLVDLQEPLEPTHPPQSIQSRNIIHIAPTSARPPL